MAYIVKAETQSGKVRYAGISDGPPVKDKGEAHAFFDRGEAETVAQKIRSVIPATCTVTVETV